MTYIEGFVRPQSEEWDIITKSIKTVTSAIASLALFLSLEPGSVFQRVAVALPALFAARSSE